VIRKKEMDKDVCVCVCVCMVLQLRKIMCNFWNGMSGLEREKEILYFCFENEFSWRDIAC